MHVGHAELLQSGDVIHENASTTTLMTHLFASEAILCYHFGSQTCCEVVENEQNGDMERRAELCTSTTAAEGDMYMSATLRDSVSFMCLLDAQRRNACSLDDAGADVLLCGFGEDPSMNDFLSSPSLSNETRLARPYDTTNFPVSFNVVRTAVLSESSLGMVCYFTAECADSDITLRCSTFETSDGTIEALSSFDVDDELHANPTGVKLETFDMDDYVLVVFSSRDWIKVAAYAANVRAVPTARPSRTRRPSSHALRMNITTITRIRTGLDTFIASCGHYGGFGYWGGISTFGHGRHSERTGP